MRESGAFLMISILLLAAPAVISLSLHHHEVLATGIAVFTILAGWPFSSLLLVVRDGRLRVKLGGLITVRNVAIADVAQVRRFRPPSLAGLGIRWLAEGTLYTVTMGDAVEIRLHDGSRFFVGSDTPDAMCAALQSRLDARSSAGPLSANSV
jgi:hypothetical protein